MDRPRLADTHTEESSTAGKLLSGGIWAAGGKVVTMTATLVLNAFVARLLSPTDVGVYFLILSIVPFATALGGMGLREAVVKLVADRIAEGHPGQARAVVGAALRWTILGGAVVAGIFALGAGNWLGVDVFNVPHLGELAVAIGLLVGLMTISNQLAESFRGFHDIRMATVTNGLANSVLPAVFVSYVFLTGSGMGLPGVVNMHLAALLLTLAMAGWVLAGKLSRLGASESHHDMSLRSLALPLMVADLSFILQARIALWIVAASLQSTDVALYGAAFRLVMLVATPLVLVNAVLPPIIAEMHTLGKRQELQRVLRGVAAVAALPSAMMFLLLAFFGRSILALVFGTYYGQAWAVLVILSVGQVVNALSGSCALTLMMTGQQKPLMVIALASAAFQAGLGIGLSKVLGLAGVALAVAGVLVLQNAVMVVWVRAKTGVWTVASPAGLVQGGRVLLRSLS